MTLIWICPLTYNFSRFSPQSFEKFIQAMATAKFGPMTQVFGRGKDGAREATFEGKISISSSESWDGYTVVQAKHMENVSSSPENVSWLKEQIDGDLSKFLDPKRALRRPEYYLLATNVYLSAAAADATGKGSGGIDVINSYLSAWATRLDLKGWMVWHQDTLAALLDTEGDLRTSYAFWVTPDDVLSAALARLNDENVSSYIPAYLRNQLRKSREVKTKDTGQATSKRLVLDDVFVDLPLEPATFFFQDLNLDELESVDTLESELIVESDDVFEGAEDDEIFEQTTFRVAQQVIARCSDIFVAGEEDDKCREMRNGRVVLMGGPGQGKSTISQFLAQIYRARQISVMPGNTAELRDAASAILARARSEGLSLDGPSRFPISVDLPTYADALSRARNDQKDVSLMAHIGALMSGGEVRFSTDHVQRWMSAVPCILILDGLDEVSHSSNRQDVIDAINAFIDAVEASRIDCFVLVTSRPQGYKKELSTRYWSHWELADLEAEDALRYGQQLGNVLIQDETRRVEILDGLVAASKDDTTAQLMTSPLQVSLLFALVETRNSIPQDRWTLFIRYYEIMRDREIAKGGSNGQLIGEYRADIDKIHYNIGYLLQLLGEKTGRSNTYIELSELGKIVRGQLENSGHEGEELNRLTNRIVDLATTRLVFLQCRTDGQVAFDVRSLQEFMAAARIMASPEDKIKKRLNEIAGISHWSHVFEIACSKIYSNAELESLRSEVLAILDALNAGDKSVRDRIVQSGGRLAAEMLVDGVPGSTPSSRRNLLTRALNLIHTRDGEAANLLARALDASTLRSAESTLKAAVLSGGQEAGRNAFRIMLLLANHHDVATSNWARERAVEWLEEANLDLLPVVNTLRLAHGEFARSLLRSALWCSPVRQALGWRVSDEQGREAIGGAEVLGVQRPGLVRVELITKSGVSTGIEVSFRPLAAMIKLPSVPPDAHEQWHLLAKVEAAIASGGTNGLLLALRIIFAADARDVVELELPWLLRAIVAQRHRGVPAEDIYHQVSDGRWGEQSLWDEWEGRWIATGLNPADDMIPRDGFLLRFPFEFYHFAPARSETHAAADEDFWRILRDTDLNQFDQTVIRFLATSPIDTNEWSVAESIERLAKSAMSTVEVRRALSAAYQIDATLNPNKWDIITLLCSKIKSITRIMGMRFGDEPFRSTIINLIEKGGGYRSLLVLFASWAINDRSNRTYSTPANVLEFESGDTPLIGEAVTLLRLSLGMSIQPELLVTVPLGSLKEMARKRLSAQQADELIASVCEVRLTAGPLLGASSATAYDYLVEHLEKRSSILADPVHALALQLPLLPETVTGSAGA